MEWVETTGKSVADAKELALDQLGVTEDEAEFMVLEEPQTGLFGRLRREARVRARVRPVRPRPKVERRRSQGGGRRRRGGEDQGPGAKAAGGRARGHRGSGVKGGTRSDRAAGDRREQPERAAAAQTSDQATPRDSGRNGGKKRARSSERKKAGETGDSRKEEAMSDVSLAEHAEIMRSFVEGLVDAFGLDAEVSVEELDEETAEVQVAGADLGVLIGARGATLQAIQSIGRTVAQRTAGGRPAGRVQLDVAGYRKKRKQALEEFARKVAAEVLESGVEKSLEPMGAADRKIVHDAVAEIPGVRTLSEGEDPRRHVVIVRDDS